MDWHEKEQDKIWDNWAQEMMDLLRQALGEVDQAQGPLAAQRQAYFETNWSALLERGEALNAPVLRTDTSADVGWGMGRRGRPNQSKAHNLLKRLRLYRADVWRFMTDKDVPFTNNLVEQALRMCKVKQKINLHACLVSVFQGQTIQPCFAE
jgi:transposase